ncbi:hypothetical protein Ancab_030780 [Ancistrocladus abbreviatus]
MGTTSVIPFVREALPTLRSVSFSAILEQRLVSSSISIGTSRGGGWDVGFLGTGGAVARSSSMNYGSSSREMGTKGVKDSGRNLIAKTRGLVGGLFSFPHARESTRLQKRGGSKIGERVFVALFPSLSPSWSLASVSCSEKCEVAR